MWLPTRKLWVNSQFTSSHSVSFCLVNFLHQADSKQSSGKCTKLGLFWKRLCKSWHILQGKKEVRSSHIFRGHWVPRENQNKAGLSRKFYSKFLVWPLGKSGSFLLWTMMATSPRTWQNKKFRGKKEKKTMFISFGGTSWNVSYFNCCWFGLAIRRRGQELYDLC